MWHKNLGVTNFFPFRYLARYLVRVLRVLLSSSLGTRQMRKIEPINDFFILPAATSNNFSTKFSRSHPNDGRWVCRNGNSPEMTNSHKLFITETLDWSGKRGKQQQHQLQMIRGQTTDAVFTETEKAAAADQSMNEQINLNLVYRGNSWPELKH